ncbi:hypothetical protein BCV70DRAFT_24642 [Testicularia cyperi]|uniref:Uncharacterized protein n=1 Tax=Testicularia cyperi TaxID=1882483 RepID=A0A317Y0Y6_9BASI|nr:hypothetical protein BCV70DRAFT_24642 [Testicularia cyperi]
MVRRGEERGSKSRSLEPVARPSGAPHPRICTSERLSICTSPCNQSAFGSLKASSLPSPVALGSLSPRRRRVTTVLASHAPLPLRQPCTLQKALLDRPVCAPVAVSVCRFTAFPCMIVCVREREKED